MSRTDWLWDRVVPGVIAGVLAGVILAYVIPRTLAELGESGVASQVASNAIEIGDVNIW